jgi:hypothetical protein
VVAASALWLDASSSTTIDAAPLGRFGGRCSLERKRDYRASRWFVVDGDGGVLVFEEAFGDREA